jgi:hypothetical protein
MRFLEYQVFRFPGQPQFFIEHAKMQSFRLFPQKNRPESVIERFPQPNGTTEYGRRFFLAPAAFACERLRLVVCQDSCVSSPRQEIDVVGQLLIANDHLARRTCTPSANGIDEIEAEVSANEVHRSRGPFI